MKLQTYKSTPGIERFPESDRLRIYRATHKQLLRDDPNYQRQSRRYMALITCLALLPLVAAFSSPVLGQAWSGFLVGGSVVAIIFLAFQQQSAMNARIGPDLPRTSTD